VAKLTKGYVAHERKPKKSSQGTRKKSIKRSSMNKSKKRQWKAYNGQGRAA
jgi:hypothetical protein|tara:strand:+ start:1995 stop:2147 length:153 start_codon:yes stop_codon:yes gene_type:complete